MVSDTTRGLEETVDVESTVRIPRGFVSMLEQKAPFLASEESALPTRVHGLVKPLEELEKRVANIGMYNGPLYSTQAQEIVEDLKATFAAMKATMPEPYKYPHTDDFSMLPRVKEERRRTEYRHDVHKAICDLMEKPSLPLTDLAPQFISERVNERTAFSVLLSIGDLIGTYNKEREAEEKTPNYQPPQFITLTKIIGLIRAYAENSYEAFRKVHPDTAEVINRYFTAHERR